MKTIIDQVINEVDMLRTAPELAPKMPKNHRNLVFDQSKNLRELAQTLKIFCAILHFHIFLCQKLYYV
uniref:Uncharacterized protein n=1 Tax=Romanomermis culicivorax TaxID=13658 RepID=A0A915J6N9_ROMCU